MKVSNMSPLKTLQVLLIVSEIAIFLAGFLLSRLFGFSMLLVYIPMTIFFFVFCVGIVSYCNSHHIADDEL